jgi:hypothetical protein
MRLLPAVLLTLVMSWRRGLESAIIANECSFARCILCENVAMVILRATLAAILLPLFTVSAATTVAYNVTTDWKNNANPNGVWQYAAGSQLLQWQSNLGSGSCFGNTTGGTRGR